MATGSAKCTADTLGILTDKPKHPQFAILEKRLETFKQLPWDPCCPVNVQDLAVAGLVNTGVGDSVRCYFCDGGLRNWEPDDDPMIEHARWYPACGHVLLMKGHGFSSQVAKGTVLHNPSLQHPNIQLKHANEAVTKKDIAVKALLENGFTEDNIHKAIHVFKRKEGRSDYKACDLFEILMDIEDGRETVEDVTEDVNEDVTEDITVEEEEQELDEAEIQRLEEENNRLRDNLACKICLERRADIVFLPCGHMVSCGQCSVAVNKCPMCRKIISGRVKSIMRGCSVEAVNSETAAVGQQNHCNMGTWGTTM